MTRAENNEDVQEDGAASEPARAQAPPVFKSGIDIHGGDLFSEEVRVLRRIEERIAESARLQERGLNSEIDDFHKQRAEFLRALAENSEAANNFRSELQRVGRQLGSMLAVMEKSSTNTIEQISELKLRMADDAVETQRLLATLIEVLNRSVENRR